MENTSQIPQQGFIERNKTIIKGFLIGALILIMLIPAALVQNLVNERAARQEQVIKEISSKWATDQTIVGPALLIPYKEYQKDKDGKVFEYRRNIYLLPDRLTINGGLLPETRSRSLYDVTLYKSSVSISGQFNSKILQQLKINQTDIIWNECHLLLGITDVRGLEENVKLQWNDTTLQLEAGLPENNFTENGLSASVATAADTELSFSVQLKLKGSEHLYFTPVGKTTEVSLNSTWKDPAFDGQYLPVKSDISGTGFSASWKVLQVSRSYPQVWKDSKYDIRSSSFGVRLIQPTDNYSKADRSVKYAILFIALTFTVFFFLEIIQKQQIHPLQYILVGLSLCIFYTLLLSISEYTGFNPAYIVAAGATVSLVGLYVWSIFKKGKIAAGFTAALACLYAYIFILIQLQDYALLFGSIGLFVIIAVLMYFSRKIDWYNTGNIRRTQ